MLNVYSLPHFCLFCVVFELEIGPP